MVGTLVGVLVVLMDVVVLNVVVVTEDSVTSPGGLVVTAEKLSRNRGMIIVNQKDLICKKSTWESVISYQQVWCVCCRNQPAAGISHWGRSRCPSVLWGSYFSRLPRSSRG